MKRKIEPTLKSPQVGDSTRDMEVKGTRLRTGQWANVDQVHVGKQEAAVRVKQTQEMGNVLLAINCPCGKTGVFQKAKKKRGLEKRSSHDTVDGGSGGKRGLAAGKPAGENHLDQHTKGVTTPKCQSSASSKWKIENRKNPDRRTVTARPLLPDRRGCEQTCRSWFLAAMKPLNPDQRKKNS